MNNFFELNEEKIIGYKNLTDADLGLSPTSHQTHIGLFDDVLTFLPNQEIIDDLAMFIYNSQCDLISLNFNRIQNSNGTFRSPKICAGGRGTISVVSTIRDIVKNSKSDLSWFLFWFGLKSKQVVFWLFNNSSEHFKTLINLGVPLENNIKNRITPSNINFSKVLTYIENNIDNSARDLLKELEIETQIPGNLIINKRIKKYDIDRAKERFSEIGKLGEEFVAEFFDKKLYNREIKTYKWVNQNGESGNPFDFYYQDLSDNIIYLDVKSTPFSFDQKVIYSDREINFAQQQATNCYNIYRIYDLREKQASLRICKHCNSHFINLNTNIINFRNSLDKLDTSIHAINLAFKPDINCLTFDNEILLKKE